MTTTRVVYIGGPARSGSTLLALLLDRLPGFVAVGESIQIWERGLVENELCGCGTPFRDCPFWTDVGRRAFGGWDTLDAEQMVALKESVNRIRHWPLLHGVSGRRFRRRVDAYADAMGRLYSSASAAAGGAVVVDSSKTITGALLLARIRSVEPRIVQLVRDSRAASFSWSRSVVRPEVTRRVAHMPRYGPAQASVDWLAYTIPYHLSLRGSKRRLLVRYESLVADPRRELERLLAYARDESESRALELAARDVDLPVNHTISGNPIRLRSGRIALRVDDEWRTAMRKRDRAVVLLLTWPLELAYGYVGVSIAPIATAPSAARTDEGRSASARRRPARR